MNILYWADGFWPRIGGTETQGWQFVQEMQRRNHSCFVIAQKDSSLWPEEEVHDGISIRRFDFDAIVKQRDLRIVRTAREYLETILPSIDIVYLNTLGNGSAFAFLLFRKLFSMPTVVTVHAPYYGRNPPPLTLQLCETVDQICSPSQWGYCEMEAILPESCKKKFCSIPYGLSLPQTLPLPLPSSPPLILLLGRLSSEKGFEVAIEAFSLLKKEGSEAKLLIIGEGDERPFLEHLVDLWSLRDSVEFGGAVPRDREEVFATINRATFVVMPSHMEAFGLVALESMRMGRPVIASNVGGLGEIIAEGLTGRLVPPNNPQAFFEAMKVLIENPRQTEEMGRKAMSWATSHHLLENTIDEYEHLFSGLLCPH